MTLASRVRAYPGLYMYAHSVVFKISMTSFIQYTGFLFSFVRSIFRNFPQEVYAVVVCLLIIIVDVVSI